MEECYWELFRTTGAPLFYLLYRQEQDSNAHAKTAWAVPPAKLI